MDTDIDLRPTALKFHAFCLLTIDYCLDKWDKDRMKNDWEMYDHAHLHLIWTGDLDLWPLTLKLLSLCPLANFHLHTKFGRDRIKNDRVIRWQSWWEKNNTQKTEQKQKDLRLRRQTLINIRYNFWTVRDRDFIFGIHTLLMMPFQMTTDAMTLWPWLWPLH